MDHAARHRLRQEKAPSLLDQIREHNEPRPRSSAASKFARASGEVKLAVDSIAQPCVWSDTY